MVGHVNNNDTIYADLLKKYFNDEESVFVFSTDFCHWGNKFGYPNFKGKEENIYKFIEKLDKEGFEFIKKKNPE